MEFLRIHPTLKKVTVVIIMTVTFFVILNMLLYRFFAIGIFPRRYAKDL